MISGTVLGVMNIPHYPLNTGCKEKTGLAGAHLLSTSCWSLMRGGGFLNYKTSCVTFPLSSKEVLKAALGM